MQVLGCLASLPVAAVAKDLQLKLQCVLRLGLAQEETLRAARLERELGTLLVASPLRRSVLADHLQVLIAFFFFTGTPRHLGYLIEGHMENSFLGIFSDVFFFAGADAECAGERGGAEASGLPHRGTNGGAARVEGVSASRCPG